MKCSVKEAEGDDSQLIAELEANVAANMNNSADLPAAAPAPAPVAEPEPEAVSAADAVPKADAEAKARGAGQAGSHCKGQSASAKPANRQKPAERTARGQQSGGGQNTARGGETIRVAVDTIERIMQLVSELVLNRNQLLEITRNRENDAIKPPLQRLSGLTTDLQDAVMRARMQPVGRLYSSLPRLMRELSAELHKKIDLVTEGADTELDRQLIEVLRDPLTHLIRNCADHGIETPDERVAAGKPEFGEIRISASHEAGQINIDISDDGRGLNLDRIREKAIANRLRIGGAGRADEHGRALPVHLRARFFDRRQGDERLRTRRRHGRRPLEHRVRSAGRSRCPPRPDEAAASR